MYIQGKVIKILKTCILVYAKKAKQEGRFCP